jgi:agmatine deiminase
MDQNTYGNSSCFLAWPFNEKLWGINLKNAQFEFILLCKSILFYRKKIKKYIGERINILVINIQVKNKIKKAFYGLPIKFYIIKYCDVWIRDTGPLFSINNKLKILNFRFNGWGGKYLFKNDKKVSCNISKILNIYSKKYNFILEEGSIEINKKKEIIMTKSCLLNKNRNLFFSIKKIKNIINNILLIKKSKWISAGLKGDHTDGHIDNVIKFISRNKIIYLKINKRKIFNSTLNISKIFKLNYSRISILSKKNVLSRSCINSYIGNRMIVIPIYESINDNQIIKILSKVFRHKKIIGIPSMYLLKGGGSFHCITKQTPFGF